LTFSPSSPSTPLQPHPILPTGVQIALPSTNATFEVLDRIDDGYDAGLKDDYPGWRLIETMDEEETARAVVGLHESLLE
jgi:hypothetical protein